MKEHYNNSVSQKEVANDLFKYYLNLFPVSIKTKRDFYGYFCNATEENRVIALMMISDAVNQISKDKIRGRYV